MQFYKINLEMYSTSLFTTGILIPHSDSASIAISLRKEGRTYSIEPNYSAVAIIKQESGITTTRVLQIKDAENGVVEGVFSSFGMAGSMLNIRVHLESPTRKIYWQPFSTSIGDYPITTIYHNDALGRDATDAHPTFSISGLDSALAGHNSRITTLENRAESEATKDYVDDQDAAILAAAKKSSVQWYSENDHRIILENAHALQGAEATGSPGQIHNLVMLNQLDQVDVGSLTAELNLNASNRPRVQLAGGSGSSTEEMAFLKDLVLIQTDGIVHIDKNSASTLPEDGTMYAPFKTITAALEKVKSGDVVKIFPGEYQENLVIDNIHNVTFTTDSSIGQYRVVINGSLTIGANAFRIGMSNIQVDGSFSLLSTQGLIYSENMTYVGQTTIQGGGYCRFTFCFFGSTVVQGSTIADIQNSQFENTSRITISSAAAVLSLSNATNVDIIHSGGAVRVGGDTTFLPAGVDKIAFRSTANLTDGGGIRFDGGTFLQADGSFAIINKTGNCPYALSNVIYEPKVSTFVGPRIDGGLHSDQLYDHTTRAGYSISSETIKGHLDGISATLENLETRLSEIENSLIT